MKKEKSDKKKPSLFLRIVICILAITVSIGVAAIFLMGTDNSEQDPQQNTDSTEAQNAAQQLLDNEFLTVSFNKVYEVDGVEGVFYLNLDMENKTDKEVWLYLDSVSVNGEMTTAMSGVPTIIAPEKKSANPFFISFSNLSISELHEVKEVSFKIVLENHETSEIIMESDQLTISQ